MHTLYYKALSVRWQLLGAALIVLVLGILPVQAQNSEPRNIIFILTDDHRYDAMSFMGHPFVETPSLDALAREGVHFKNAFVTTSLCSPSRASILTGQYMHNHGIVDNGNPIRKTPSFFSEYLQETGYETAFVGKWHMGGASDRRRPGFDHWVSFRGQGRYFPPENSNWTLNVNGKRVPQKGYITDELTEYALNWLNNREKDEPFFLYLSHKGIHDPFTPAKRHADRYDKEPVPTPPTMANTAENYAGKPMWVKNQRNSWHGVDFPYQGLREAAKEDQADRPNAEMRELYQRYQEALLSVDQSTGRVMEWLEENGLAESTLVVYMGDNGFQWGEHGLIDKRTAYEASMKVPLLARCPELFEKGTVVDEMVANIDIAPTLMEVAGLETPENMDGESFLGLATGEMNANNWRDYLLYEYYWENSFPQTPTTYAVRGERFKLIQYYGIWDMDELYDLQNDPQEATNLIAHSEYQQEVQQMRDQLHQLMEQTGADAVPLRPKRGPGQSLRKKSGSKADEFPSYFEREEKGRVRGYKSMEASEK